MTGEPLEPVLSNTAAAQRRGEIGAEHVKIIRRFFDKLPGFVDYDTREAAEAQLAELACGLRPEELRVGRRPAGHAARPGRRTVRRRPGPAALPDHRQAAAPTG